MGRLFLLGSTALLAITFGQVMVLAGQNAPDHAPAYPGTGETFAFLGALLLLYASTLSISLALLKRLPWARPAFVTILGFGVVLNLGKLVWTALDDSPEPLPTEGPAPYLFILRAATVLDVLVPLAVIALFGWLIVRLNSTPLRAEFQPHDRGT